MAPADAGRWQTCSWFEPKETKGNVSAAAETPAFLSCCCGLIETLLLLPLLLLLLLVVKDEDG